MKKITFSNLTIELTRKCNLQCSHCYCGESQNRYISKEVIDACFNTVDYIYALNFTGGEPFLSIDAMLYILDIIKKNNIVLGGMQITTNATIQNDDVIYVIREYNKYIQTIVEVEAKNNINISVSCDRYHGTKEECQKRYEWYYDNLRDYATICKNRAGDVPYKVGRAINLNYADNFTASYKPTKVLYKSADCDPICSEKNFVPWFCSDQKIILCSIFLDIFGNIQRANFMMDYESREKNEIIYNVLDCSDGQEIIQAIEKYNIGKPYCKMASPIENPVENIIDDKDLIPVKNFARKHFNVDLDKDPLMKKYIIALYNALLEHPEPKEYAKDVLIRLSRSLTPKGVRLIKSFVGLNDTDFGTPEECKERILEINNLKESDSYNEIMSFHSDLKEDEFEVRCRQVRQYINDSPLSPDGYGQRLTSLQANLYCPILQEVERLEAERNKPNLSPDELKKINIEYDKYNKAKKEMENVWM